MIIRDFGFGARTSLVVAERGERHCASVKNWSKVLDRPDSHGPRDGRHRAANDNGHVRPGQQGGVDAANAGGFAWRIATTMS